MSGPIRSGVVAPLLVDHVNTDLIIRSRDIPPRATDDFGRHLFACWRERPEDDFVLDRPGDRAATMLLTGGNFGCGSSREAAVWALRDVGIECVIATSFGSIFFSNCIQNQIVPVVLPVPQHAEIAALVAAGGPSVELTVDVPRLRVELPDGRSFPFDLNPVQRSLLATRRSALDLIREHTDAIADFQTADVRRRPWAYLRQ
jgi:3-isopropylmalate/(R)-2-methylmalate dehydratase small subunit